MVEVIVCKHSFAIVTGAGIPYEIDHSAGEMRERYLLRCVYLTRSIAVAVELQTVAKCISLRVHRASDLREALLLLRVTGAHVVLVDLPFLRQDLQARHKQVEKHQSFRCGFDLHFRGTRVIQVSPLRRLANMEEDDWEEFILRMGRLPAQQARLYGSPSLRE